MLTGPIPNEPCDTLVGFCFDPTCRCYGVTIYQVDGGETHRAFTAVELLVIAGAWADGAL